MLPKKVRDDYKAAVKRGAAKLDKKIPKWWSKIDLKLLHLGDSEKCMIGQLKGEYNTCNILSVVNGMSKKLDEVSAFMKSAEMAIQHGFNYNEDLCQGDYTVNQQHYSCLTELWRDLIIERWLKMPKSEAKKLLVAALAKDEDVC